MENSESKATQLKGKLAAFLLHTLGLLPLSVAQFIGAFLGWLLWFFPTSAKRVTLINLDRCFPNESKDSRNKTARLSLIQSGMMMLEIAPLWIKPFEWGKQFIVSVEGEELIDQAADKGAGILFITPHIGNWELLSQYIASRFQVTAMYRPSKLKAVDNIILSSRAEPGTIMAPTNIRGVKQLKDCLNSGGTTVIFPDQVPHERGGVYVPFFAESCFTGVLVPRLLRNSEITPLCIYCRRLGIGKGFEVRVVPVNPAIKSADVPIATRAVNEVIETIVTTDREQYQWSYKRFKEEGRPGGKVHY
ncbi:MAG: lysophospholipid acyltransferase family protein [Pseudomonadales bacterium]|nr:lysophospholipid acyltransferase family protein [Pseudomonadales bacterium]